MNTTANPLQSVMDLFEEHFDKSAPASTYYDDQLHLEVEYQDKKSAHSLRLERGTRLAQPRDIEILMSLAPKHIERLKIAIAIDMRRCQGCDEHRLHDDLRFS